jgi:ElaB/YqjD/DUF883 family membrane-anchored ribosome-binding protein
MDKKLKDTIEAAERVSRRLSSCVDELNSLLKEANETGLHVIIQKDESYVNEAPLSKISIKKSTYHIEYTKDKPG